MVVKYGGFFDGNHLMLHNAPASRTMPLYIQEIPMNATALLDPLISEFETEQEAESYDRWFRAKVHEAIHSPHPRIPHDEAMASIERIVAERRKARADA